MQILGLLGMYFDAVVVEVEKYLLFFRFALAILCGRADVECWNLNFQTLKKKSSDLLSFIFSPFYLVSKSTIRCPCPWDKMNTNLHIFGYLVIVITFTKIFFFQNTACNSTSTDNRIGTCYTTEECEEKDGTASGYCANGYGVCCLSKFYLA